METDFKTTFMVAGKNFKCSKFKKWAQSLLRKSLAWGQEFNQLYGWEARAKMIGKEFSKSRY